MGTIYDIVGSMVIGGIILLMLLSFNSTVMEGAAVQTFNGVVQSNMTSLSDLLEHDFRKIGYRVAKTYDSNFTYADPEALIFKGDINNDGVVDRVSYFFDKKKKAPNKNPRTRILYREVNGVQSQAMNLGLTNFRFRYYDAADSLIHPNPVVANPTAIKSVRVLMTMESLSPYDTTYAGVTWERTIMPRNIQ
jgi:hypothetical protein